MYVGVALIVVFIDFLACFNNIYFYSYKNNYKVNFKYQYINLINMINEYY